MKRIEGMIACVAITGALVYAPAQKLLCNLESGLHKHVQVALLRGDVPQVPPVANFTALPPLPNAIAISRSAPLRAEVQAKMCVQQARMQRQLARRNADMQARMAREQVRLALTQVQWQMRTGR